MARRKPPRSPGEGERPNGRYEVGYGRPPKDHQFKPGQSGNPKGRPKGSKSFSTYLQEALAELVALNGNTHRRMPKKQIFAKQLVNKALGIEPRAATLLLHQIDQLEGPADQQPVSRMLTPTDEVAFKGLLQRIRLFDASQPEGSDEEDAQ